MKQIKTILLVITGLILLFIFTKYILWLEPQTIAKYYRERVCIKSHKESYMVTPTYMSIGNGISVPIGNAQIRTRVVCDEYNI